MMLAHLARLRGRRLPFVHPHDANALHLIELLPHRLHGFAQPRQTIPLELERETDRSRILLAHRERIGSRRRGLGRSLGHRRFRARVRRYLRRRRVGRARIHPGLRLRRRVFSGCPLHGGFRGRPFLRRDLGRRRFFGGRFRGRRFGRLRRGCRLDRRFSQRRRLPKDAPRELGDRLHRASSSKDERANIRSSRAFGKPGRAVGAADRPNQLP
jgi:hypothetical protein